MSHDLVVEQYSSAPVLLALVSQAGVPVKQESDGFYSVISKKTGNLSGNSCGPSCALPRTWMTANINQ